MPSQDWIRVLRGVGLVAEQVAKNSKPLEEQSKRVLSHAADLITLAPQLFTSVPPTLSEPSATTSATDDDNLQHEFSSLSTTTPSNDVASTALPPASPAPEVPPSTPSQPYSPPRPQPTQLEALRPSIEAKEWTEKHVPSSPLARIVGFGALAARLAVGTATAVIQNQGSSEKKSIHQAFVSDANAERLADALCTMRGAALKLGQMLSIQDENLIPPQLAAALDRVRQGAHIMPKSQLFAQLTKEWGPEWRDHFEAFDDVPLAAASIGQVHKATLVTGEVVAVKVQYPGVAESISSDLLNLKRLVTYMNVFPKGLYIDEIIRVGQEELTAECNYTQEAENQTIFKTLVDDYELSRHFIVPTVYPDLSTNRILTTSFIEGVPLDKIVLLSQEIRNHVARQLLQLTIHELFVWRFMQTDPNWSNFLYDPESGKIGLIDFGAARAYPKEFVDTYFDIVWGAAQLDANAMMDSSFKLGFLTGDESKDMLAAHEAAGMVVGEPFASAEPFDFHGSQLTRRLAKHTEMFMSGRLTPPPREVYSLHRKLAGAFLMCIKLKAVIPCRDVLEDVAKLYHKQ
ncbi:Atypical/ABC1/ABC1-A protein kinase [Aphanomyces astaci]|uniref:Atypical/ABC1/ABC1-A protein kinase n=3 Tax=Aphanomyces astaci TaxID=112090 RepID=W4GAQ1_APHAT|nr:Atypical/ABC1/ABC1-A protein kinase [Aphanomyces astaci]ETV76745.1 Atypical/ABC1/ABC1-A protein kinase [Aphanomyces astaci]|eukprot:XP_009833657.1 Atypical/ABC1/ABC1-A protein kinase [Aphanomyces astaci]